MIFKAGQNMNVEIVESKRGIEIQIKEYGTVKVEEWGEKGDDRIAVRVVNGNTPYAPIFMAPERK